MMWLREILSVENIEVENAFDMKNKYRNIYEGTTWYEASAYESEKKEKNDEYCNDYSFCNLRVKINTAAPAGWLRTPWYKENYDPNNFQYLAYYTWHIHPPNNLATYDTNNLTLVLHFDGQLYKDREWVTIDDDENPYNDEVLYDVDNVTKRYNASQLKTWGTPQTAYASHRRKADIELFYVQYHPVKIHLFRKIGEKDLKKDTGFVLEWYYEDNHGNKVQLKTDRQLFLSNVYFNTYDGRKPSVADYIETNGGTYINNENEWYYRDKTGGKIDLKKFVMEQASTLNPISQMHAIFSHFMELVYKAITEQNMDFDELWGIAKRIRLNQIHKELHGEKLFCNEQDLFYLFAKELNMNIPHSTLKVPVYNAEINDSLLLEGFRLFYFTFRCLDPFVPRKVVENNDFGDNLFNYYKNIFKKDSEETILEAVLSILNMDRKQKAGIGFQILDKNKYQKPLKDTNTIISSAQKLVEKLQSIIPLDLFKLFILSTSNTTLLTRLDTIIDPQIRRNNILENCLLNNTNNTCEKVQKLLTNLGEDQLLNIGF